MGSLEETLFSSGLPVAALMEKVGQAMAAWLLERPQLLTEGVLVLVGPGHNGGDGLVVARELHLAGISVQLWCPIPARKSLTEAHWRHVLWLGVQWLEQQPDPAMPQLWLDALFGLGQTRPLPSDLVNLFRQRAALNDGRLISLDVPSGLCSDTGEPLGGEAARAAVTLTVGLFKRGLALDQARPWVGSQVRIDVGLPRHVLRGLGASPLRRLPVSEACTVPVPALPTTAMKYQRGRCLVVAGSERFPGAAHLALQGAMASGCGSVQAVLPARVAQTLWQVIPEVIVESDAMPLERLDGVLFGPGLGVDPQVWAHWSERLLRFEGLLVLDADGLNGLAASADGWRWLLKRQGPTWLTPHGAEFARLFPHCCGSDQLNNAIAAARCSGCCVLHKSAHSVVAEPQGSGVVLVETSPWAARTGLGDILAGFCTGWGAKTLAAKGEPDLESFAAAACLHGYAAAEARSSEASAVAECLKINTEMCQKSHTKLFNKTLIIAAHHWPLAAGPNRTFF